MSVRRVGIGLLALAIVALAAAPMTARATAQDRAGQDAPSVACDAPAMDAITLAYAPAFSVVLTSSTSASPRADRVRSVTDSAVLEVRDTLARVHGIARRSPLPNRDSTASPLTLESRSRLRAPGSDACHARVASSAGRHATPHRFTAG